jgi:hypothetical protein
MTLRAPSAQPAPVEARIAGRRGSDSDELDSELEEAAHGEKSRLVGSGGVRPAKLAPPPSFKLGKGKSKMDKS